MVGKPDDARAKIAVSSMVICLATAEDAEAVLRLRRLYVYGHQCLVTRYEERETRTTCTNCWSPIARHNASRCPSEARCRLCAGQHHTDEHQCQECSEANDSDNDMSGRPKAACEHMPLKCVNCSGPHAANDPTCPARKRAAGSNAVAPPMAGHTSTQTASAARRKRRTGARKPANAGDANAPASGSNATPLGAAATARGTGTGPGETQTPTMPVLETRTPALDLSAEEVDKARIQSIANAFLAEFGKPAGSRNDYVAWTTDARGDLQAVFERVQKVYEAKGLKKPEQGRLSNILAKFAPKTAEGATQEQAATAEETTGEMEVDQEGTSTPAGRIRPDITNLITPSSQ